MSAGAPIHAEQRRLSLAPAPELRCHHVAECGPVECPYCRRKFPVPIIRPGMPHENQIAAMPGIGGVGSAQIAAMQLHDVLRLASSRAELERVAMIRGYKRGWVDHVLRERMDRTGWRRFG